MTNLCKQLAIGATMGALLSVLAFAQQSSIGAKASSAYDKHAYAECGPLYLLAAQSEPDVAGNLYNAACCFALAGQNDLAFQTLAIAVKKGWRDRAHTETDTDLASLHNDPRWKEFLAAIPILSPKQTNMDGLINDLNNLAAYSYQYRIRPSTMGGGDGTYLGLKLPEKLAKNAHGSYELLSVGKDVVQFRATSSGGFGTVESSIDKDGRLFDWKYSGDFAVQDKAPKPAEGIQDTKDAMINDLNNLAAWSYQYRIRPSEMGGGNGSYVGLKIPEKLSKNENAGYTATAEKDRVAFLATSVKGYGTISVTLDGDGRLAQWTYTGQLQ